MIGSQLHFRLIILFAGLSAVPAIFLSIFAAAVLDFSLRGWFSSKISTAISESVQVAEAYLMNIHDQSKDKYLQWQMILIEKGLN